MRSWGIKVEALTRRDGAMMIAHYPDLLPSSDPTNAAGL
jgi:hypothetical protein